MNDFKVIVRSSPIAADCISYHLLVQADTVEQALFTVRAAIRNHNPLPAANGTSTFLLASWDSIEVSPA